MSDSCGVIGKHGQPPKSEKMAKYVGYVLFGVVLVLIAAFTVREVTFKHTADFTVSYKVLATPQDKATLQLLEVENGSVRNTQCEHHFCSATLDTQFGTFTIEFTEFHRDLRVMVFGDNMNAQRGEGSCSCLSSLGCSGDVVQTGRLYVHVQDRTNTSKES